MHGSFHFAHQNDSLSRLGYATSSDVIEVKGRVACEISRSVGIGIGLRLFYVLLVIHCVDTGFATWQIFSEVFLQYVA